MEQAQQHDREKEDRLQLEGKGDRQRDGGAGRPVACQIIQAQHDKKHIHRIALAPARAIHQHRRQEHHSEEDRQLRPLPAKTPRRAHHHKGERVIKGDGDELDQVQIKQRHLRNQQKKVLVDEVVIAHALRQLPKAPHAESLQPAAEEGVVIRRHEIEHAHAGEHRRRRERAGKQERSPARLFLKRERAHRPGIYQREQRGKAHRLPRALYMQKKALHQRRLRRKQRKRHARYEQQAAGFSVFFHTQISFGRDHLMIISYSRFVHNLCVRANWHGHKNANWQFTSRQFVL